MAENKPGVPKASVSDKQLKKVVGDIEKMLNKTGEVGRAAAIGTVLENFGSPKKYLTYKVATRNLSKLINQLGKQTDEINALANIGEEGLEVITKVGEAMGNISSPMKVRAFNYAVKSFSKNTELFKKIGSDKQITDGIKNIIAISKAIEPLSSPLKILGVKNSLKLLDGAFDQFAGKKFERMEGIKDLVDAFANPVKVIGAKLGLAMLGKSMGDLVEQKEEVEAEPVTHRGLRTAAERQSEIDRTYLAEGGVVSPTKGTPKSIGKVVDKATNIRTPGGPAVVGEAGPEAIVPLSKMPEVAEGMTKGAGTPALAAGQQEMIDNQENLDSGQEVLQTKSTETLRQISDIKNTLGLMATGAAATVASKVISPEAESLINGIIANASLIGSALFVGFGAWLAKEHPGLAVGLKHVVGIGRTVAKYGSKFIEWFPKIGKVTEKLVKWGDDIMKWGAKMISWPMKLVKMMQGIPIIGSMFKSMAAKGMAKVAVKGGSKKFFGKVLATVLKKIPLVGLGASMYFAYDRFSKGDMVGAAMELGSGVASLVPGPGTVISGLMDAALVARDATMKPEKRKKQTFADAGKDVLSMLMAPYKNFGGNVVDAYDFASKSQWPQAGISLAKAGTAALGPVGSVLNWAIEKLEGKIEPEKNVPTLTASQKATGESIAASEKRSTSKGYIPHASGGFVNQPTRALIGEAGPEAVIPLGEGFKEFGDRLLEHMGSVDGLKTMTKSMSNGSVSEQASIIKGVERDSITEQIAAMLPMLMAAQSGGGGQTVSQQTAPPMPPRVLQSSDGGFMNQLFKYKFNM